jgi:hypothetical protein
VTPDGNAVPLWLAVVAIGAWHGLNPSMGWPLAVANGLGERRPSAVFATFAPLGLGHLLAMAVTLLPFAVLGSLLAWGREIRIGAGALVTLFGLYRLIDRRHPRWLARVRPTQLALWSFLIASAHGAGLMLLPFALGLCAASPAGPQPVAANATTALAVAVVHTLAMLGAGLAAAWVVYRHFGLRMLQRGWLNLEAVWGASLVVAGAASLVMTMASGSG